MDNPLVTILTPCYNVGQYVGKCIESILSQSYQNLQVVMIDDGSTDNTLEVMQKYAAKDSRIEVYAQKNHGVAYTRNQLLEKIRGEYILFVDADDWIEPDMVEFLVSKAIQYKADVVTCGMVINDSMPSTDYTEILLDRAETIKKFLFHEELRGSLWNKLVKTSLLQGISFDNAIGYGEDALFCWQIFQRVDKVVLSDRQLYHYRMNEQSISHQTFGEKKLTGHRAWEIINEETAKWWPQFLDIAQARWGMESMYLLRQAGQSKYGKDCAIIELQKTVRSFLPKMKSAGLLQGREIFNATIMSYWYGYNILYDMLNRLKCKLK